MTSEAESVRKQLDDIGQRIETARRSIDEHGIGGEDLDAELSRMRTAQHQLKEKVARGGGDSAEVLAAEAENLRNTFERWVTSNEHRFSGGTHRHTGI